MYARNLPSDDKGEIMLLCTELIVQKFTEIDQKIAHDICAKLDVVKFDHGRFEEGVQGVLQRLNVDEAGRNSTVVILRDFWSDVTRRTLESAVE